MGRLTAGVPYARSHFPPANLRVLPGLAPHSPDAISLTTVVNCVPILTRSVASTSEFQASQTLAEAIGWHRQAHADLRDTQRRLRGEQLRGSAQRRQGGRALPFPVGAGKLWSNMDSQPAGARVFRPITTADIPTVIRLYAQICPDCTNITSDLPAILRDTNATSLLLEAGGQPMGMVLGGLRTSLSSGKHFVVDDLVVDAPCRGRGLGTALMEQVIGLAKRNGCNSIELHCSKTKPELHKFYEHLGFRHRVRCYSLFL
jgi:GNAT superfamily N-acetyltransferase